MRPKLVIDAAVTSTKAEDIDQSPETATDEQVTDVMMVPAKV